MLTAALTFSTVYGLLGTGAMRNRARLRKRDRALRPAVIADGAPTPCPPPGDRIEAFAVPSGIEDVDVAILCRDAMRNAESVAHQQLAKMRIAVVDGMVVRGDPRALRAAMTRLLETATRSSPCGEILVSGAPQGGRVQIAVTADSTHPATPEATQTALAPAERIFAMHGGTFQVERSMERGTRFTVRLLAQAATGVRDDAERMAPAASAVPAPDPAPVPAPTPAPAAATTAGEAAWTRRAVPLYVHS